MSSLINQISSLLSDENDLLNSKDRDITVKQWLLYQKNQFAKIEQRNELHQPERYF